MLSSRGEKRGSPDLYSKSGADAAFLGKTAQAADSDKLDGIDSTGFLGATAKAADSDKLDGIDSTGFVQTANLPSIRYGLIDGTTDTIHASSGGWTATRTGTGTYTITFGDTGHGQTIVSLTPIGGNPPGDNCVLGNALANNAHEVRCYEGNGATPWVPWDVAYHVIAIGG